MLIYGHNAIIKIIVLIF